MNKTVKSVYVIHYAFGLHIKVFFIYFQFDTTYAEPMSVDESRWHCVCRIEREAPSALRTEVHQYARLESGPVLQDAGATPDLGVQHRRTSAPMIRAIAIVQAGGSGEF